MMVYDDSPAKAGRHPRGRRHPSGRLTRRSSRRSRSASGRCGPCPASRRRSRSCATAARRARRRSCRRRCRRSGRRCPGRRRSGSAAADRFGSTQYRGAVPTSLADGALAPPLLLGDVVRDLLQDRGAGAARVREGAAASTSSPSPTRRPPSSIRSSSSGRTRFPAHVAIDADDANFVPGYGVSGTPSFRPDRRQGRRAGPAHRLRRRRACRSTGGRGRAPTQPQPADARLASKVDCLLEWRLPGTRRKIVMAEGDLRAVIGSDRRCLPVRPSALYQRGRRARPIVCARRIAAARRSTSPRRFHVGVTSAGGRTDVDALLSSSTGARSCGDGTPEPWNGWSAMTANELAGELRRWTAAWNSARPNEFPW